MRICLMIEGQEGVSWEQWLALALAAEQAELDGLFRSDHYRSIHRGDPAGSLDAWATLAALAARTSRIRLGTLVSPTSFRPVSVLAKSVVTVDEISGGRVELGIGAGWFEPDHDAYGFPFGTVGERMSEFERQLEEINRQWTSADDVWPKPVQKPRPPIIVGGGAKPRSVRAAVAFADEYNTVVPTLEQARERCAIVREAAVAAGRELRARPRRGRGPRPSARMGRILEDRPPAGAGGHGRGGRADAARVRGGRRRARDAAAPPPRGRRDGRAARRARPSARGLTGSPRRRVVGQTPEDGLNAGRRRGEASPGNRQKRARRHQERPRNARSDAEMWAGEAGVTFQLLKPLSSFRRLYSPRCRPLSPRVPPRRPPFDRSRGLRAGCSGSPSTRARARRTWRGSSTFRCRPCITC